MRRWSLQTCRCGLQCRHCGTSRRCSRTLDDLRCCTRMDGGCTCLDRPLDCRARQNTCKTRCACTCHRRGRHRHDPIRAMRRRSRQSRCRRLGPSNQVLKTASGRAHLRSQWRQQALPRVRPQIPTISRKNLFACARCTTMYADVEPSILLVATRRWRCTVGSPPPLPYFSTGAFQMKFSAMNVAEL
jgi:hypothetical protein